MRCVTFYNNGDPGDGSGSTSQPFVVPPGIRQLAVTVEGSPGVILGGIGGQVDGIVPVTPGETLDLFVAGFPTGTEFTFGGRSYGHVGGWPDGGDGGPNVYARTHSYPVSSQAAGGGGGSSRIERAGAVLVHAGGGGGGAYASGWLVGGSRGGGLGVPGGGGTDYNGFSDIDVPTQGNPGPPHYGSGGNPGLLTGPGTAGHSMFGTTSAAQDGDTAFVGAGGNAARQDGGDAGDGGGGGGGHHGGGGGGVGDGGAFHDPPGGGGGGGSSYADPAVTGVVYSGGGVFFGSGPVGGRIIICWEQNAWVAVI